MVVLIKKIFWNFEFKQNKLKNWLYMYKIYVLINLKLIRKLGVVIVVDKRYYKHHKFQIKLIKIKEIQLI